MLTCTKPVVEFCGEILNLDATTFTIGREGDLVLDDDNRFLHRRFLSLSEQHGVWLLANLGSQLTATVSDSEGRLEAFLAPGAVLPLVFSRTVVRCTAGPTTYEFAILFDEPVFRTAWSDVEGDRGGDGDTRSTDASDETVGRVALTRDQTAMIVALAEPALRGGGRASTMLPSSTDAALRLGWTITKFNRKLDNVCAKLTDAGVRGLHGDAARLASNRRARLVEYALAVRLITHADLELLPTTVRGPRVVVS